MLRARVRARHLWRISAQTGRGNLLPLQDSVIVSDAGLARAQRRQSREDNIKVKNQTFYTRVLIGKLVLVAVWAGTNAGVLLGLIPAPSGLQFSFYLGVVIIIFT